MTLQPTNTYQHIGVCLEGERGNTLEDSQLNFADILEIAQQREKDWPWVSSIDPYGDTLFNVHQIPKVIQELNSIRNFVTDDLKKSIDSTVSFLLKVEQHLYIRFIGD